MLCVWRSKPDFFYWLFTLV